jgi:TIR domain
MRGGMSESIKVFVSYSWATENDTHILDEVDKFCPPRNLMLIRDCKTLKHGEPIDKFMNELTKAEHIITVFSKPYFKSKWCLYELLKIYQRGDFEQRTHALIADECNLQDEDYRLHITDFWTDKFNALDKKLKGHNTLDVMSEYEYLDLYRKIYQNINEIVNFASRRVTTKLPELRAQHYEPLLANLAPIKTSEPDSDSVFMAHIKKKIADELTADEVKPFRDILKLELDTLLESLKHSKTLDHQGESIADGLVLALRIGGTHPPVINKVLMNAANYCLDKDKKGAYYQASLGNREAIKHAIEQVIGWLILSAVDDVYATQLNRSTQYAEAEYFELPVATLAGVEVIVSRHFKRQPKVKPEGSQFSPNYVLDAFSAISATHWKTTSAVEELKIRLWNQVFQDRTKTLGESLTAGDLEDLNAELGNLRSYDDDKLKQHYLIAFKSDKGLSNAFQEDIYQQLLKGLENLTLVRFGVIEGQSAFYVPERSLMSAVRLFLNHINGFAF